MNTKNESEEEIMLVESVEISEIKDSIKILKDMMENMNIINENSVSYNSNKIDTTDIPRALEVAIDRLENYTPDNKGKHNSGHKNAGHHNTGDWNTGHCNNGDWNSGNKNTGSQNSGDENKGDKNAGNWNTGYCNAGDSNIGNHNSGDENKGNNNTGFHNIGNDNTGDNNTGYNNAGWWNKGKYNTGDWNTGNYNTGDFNKSSYNTGCFMTEDQKIMLFNKPSDWTYDDWRHSKAKELLEAISEYVTDFINDEEKAENPDYKTAVGYLRIKDETKIKQECWDSLCEENKNIIKALPNFDAKIFEECTGIHI